MEVVSKKSLPASPRNSKSEPCPLVFATLTDSHKCAGAPVVATAPPASAPPASPSVDLKALEIKRQEFNDLRRKSEELRARALKAEGEAREAADRAKSLEEEVDASKKKSDADKERIKQLSGLYDSSETLCKFLQKRNQSVSTSYVTLEETHKQLEGDYNKLKEEMKVSATERCEQLTVQETHGFVAVFMEGEGRMVRVARYCS